MGWPDPYFNSKNALPEADLQKAQSLYESVEAMKKESRLKWMRRNKGGDPIVDYVRKRIMQDVRNNEAKGETTITEITCRAGCKASRMR